MRTSLWRKRTVSPLRSSMYENTFSLVSDMPSILSGE